MGDVRGRSDRGGPMIRRALYALYALRAVRCPLCREKTRHYIAHVWVNHFGEDR